MGNAQIVHRGVKSGYSKGERCLKQDQGSLSTQGAIPLFSGSALNMACAHPIRAGIRIASNARWRSASKAGWHG
jgi:hypothetical protein